MAKRVIEEVVDKKVELKKEETKAVVKKPASVSLEDLVKQLKDKEQLKVVIENQYHQLCGQIQLLVQMISVLQEKDKK